MMGHKSFFVRNSTEEDAIYARHWYCYLKNIPSVVKFCKRQINKRERKYYNEEMKNEAIEEENDSEIKYYSIYELAQDIETYSDYAILANSCIFEKKIAISNMIKSYINTWHKFPQEKPEQNVMVLVKFESGLKTTAYMEEVSMNGFTKEDVCYIPVYYWKDYNMKKIDESEGRIIEWHELYGDEK